MRAVPSRCQPALAHQGQRVDARGARLEQRLAAPARRGSRAAGASSPTAVYDDARRGHAARRRRAPGRASTRLRSSGRSSPKMPQLRQWPKRSAHAARGARHPRRPRRRAPAWPRSAGRRSTARGSTSRRARSRGARRSRRTAAQWMREPTLPRHVSSGSREDAGRDGERVHHQSPPDEAARVREAVGELGLAGGRSSRRAVPIAFAASTTTSASATCGRPVRVDVLSAA